MKNKAEAKPGLISSFNAGAGNGLNLALKSMIPALLMGYLVMQFLTVSNLISVIEVVFSPLMGIFGLPGVAVSALLMAYLTSSGSLGIAANLYLTGLVNESQIAIIVVGIFCLDSTIQYIGRVLGTSGVKTKYYPLFIGMNTINAVFGMVIARIVIAIL